MYTTVASLPMAATAASDSTTTTAGTGSWFARAGSVVWRALQVTGRARAQRHLREFANECEALQPELAKELRAASRHNPLG